MTRPSPDRRWNQTAHVSLGTNRIDTAIRASSTRLFHKAVVHIFLVEIDCICLTLGFRHAQSLGYSVDRDNPLRSEHPRALNSELTHRTASQTVTVSPSSIWQFSAAIYPVGKLSERNNTWSSDSPDGDFDRTDIGERNAQIFSRQKASDHAATWVEITNK